MDMALFAPLQFCVDEDVAVDMVVGMPLEDREMVSFPLRIRELLVVMVRIGE